MSVSDQEAEAFWKDLKDFAGAEKCKREGHDFAPAWLEDERLLRCPSCGKYQQIPKLSEDQREALLDPLSYLSYPFRQAIANDYKWQAY